MFVKTKNDTSLYINNHSSQVNLQDSKVFLFVFKIYEYMLTHGHKGNMTNIFRDLSYFVDLFHEALGKRNNSKI